MGGVVGDTFDFVGGTLFGSQPEPGRAEDVTPEAFRNLRQPIADQLMGMINSGGGPRFTGPMTANMTGNESALLNQIFQQGTQGGVSNTAQQQLQNTIQGDFLSPDSNPFLQATIQAAQRPIIQQFEEQTMPNMRAQFTQAGQQVQGESGSSPFAMAAARAQSGLADALGDVSTNIAGQNFQQERSRQQQATLQAPQFDQAQVNTLMQTLQSQALPRLVEQEGIDRGLQEFQRRTNALMQALQLTGQLASPNPVSVQGSPGQAGAVQSFVGGLGQGLGGMFGG